MSLENKYLIIKTNAIIEKLKEKYEKIVIYSIENDPGNLRIGFKTWGWKHKFILVLGGKNEQSFWINNVNFKTSVPNNGSIEPSNLYKEFDDLCIIIDNLLNDHKNIITKSK